MRGWDGVAAGAVVFADGSSERVGDPHRIFALASLTKLYTAMAVLVAHEEGTLDLDEELSAGVTTADLLAHSAGVAPEERRWVAPEQLVPSFLMMCALPVTVPYMQHRLRTALREAREDEWVAA